MNLQDVIKKRRSIRKYKRDKVAPEQVRQLLEAARLAPSDYNSQPWRFIIVQSENTKEKLQKATYDEEFIGQAPAILVCCGDVKAFQDRNIPHDTVSTFLNTAIAVEHIVLQATEMGLGTCWVRLFDEKKVREILNIPDHIVVVALLPIGYPAEKPSPAPRMELPEFTFYESYANRDKE